MKTQEDQKDGLIQEETYDRVCDRGGEHETERGEEREAEQKGVQGLSETWERYTEVCEKLQQNMRKKRQNRARNTQSLQETSTHTKISNLIFNFRRN